MRRRKVIIAIIMIVVFGGAAFLIYNNVQKQVKQLIELGDETEVVQDTEENNIEGSWQYQNRIIVFTKKQAIFTDSSNSSMETYDYYQRKDDIRFMGPDTTFELDYELLDPKHLVVDGVEYKKAKVDLVTK